MPNWRPYVPVAKRRANAERKMKALAKKGTRIQPIIIEGRTIAKSFWGKGWCTHLEQFSDYSNRLPRGRTYARNGSVVHLEILAGCIEAKVVGSDIYNVTIKIEPLKKTIWKRIKKSTVGQIGTVLELLQGALSDEVMRVVTDPKNGLFPKPREISLGCSCPDWAVMCKHVAAVLYGVGNRLDHEPELLFLLRGVDAKELIDGDLALATKRVKSKNALSDDQLGNIFGVDLDMNGEAPPLPRDSKAQRPARNAKTKAKSKAANKPKTKPKVTAKRTPKKKLLDIAPPIATQTNSPDQPTGGDVVLIRKTLELSVAEFAARVGVSPATVYRWESTPGLLNIRPAILQAMDRVFDGK